MSSVNIPAPSVVSERSTSTTVPEVSGRFEGRTFEWITVTAIPSWNAARPSSMKAQPSRHPHGRHGRHDAGGSSDVGGCPVVGDTVVGSNATGSRGCVVAGVADSEHAARKIVGKAAVQRRMGDATTIAGHCAQAF